MADPRTNNNNVELRRAVAATLVSTAVLSFPAAGQITADDDDAVEEIVVTGSRLLRRNFSSPSPILTVDAEEIRLAGATNVEDLLNTLPQVIPDSDRTNNFHGDSIASINLRGMGANRTLVMLDGNRFAPSGVGGVVDINNIPSALIERVEVVAGGASAVYGSDAVVGVVNFVLDDEFEGIEINVQYDVTQEGDGDVFDLGISGGVSLAGGRAHLSGFFNYNDRKSILSGDRDFTSVVIDDDSETGELFEAGSFIAPDGVIVFPQAIVGGSPVGFIVFEQDGSVRPFVDPDDRFNYAPDNYLQVPLKRYMAAGFLNFDFNENLSGIVEILLARNDIDRQAAPVPATEFVSATIDNPFLPAATQQVFRDSYDPDDDGIADFFVLRRMVESGPRRAESTRDAIRALAGLDGSFGDTWRWQSYFSITDTDVNPTRENDVSVSRFRQALLIDPSTGACLDPSGGCVPANIYGAGNISDAAIEFMRFGTIENREEVQERIFSASISGNAVELPAGPLGVAGGVEWRRLEALLTPDPILGTGDSLGFSNFQPAIGPTEVAEVFGEVMVPLLGDRPYAEHLAVEAGARYSDYSTAGTVETWKLGAEWIPFDGLRLRAMLQRAIRAPNILELFETPLEVLLEGFDAETDLCSASRDPVGKGLTEVCIAQGMDPALVGIFEPPDVSIATFFFGGNPDLEPEESGSITAGLVITPPTVPNLSASIDYFSIEISGAITNIGSGALAACFAGKDADSNLCSSYVRDETGQIAEAHNFPRNVAIQESEGIDVQVLYAIDAPSLFDAGASFDLTFYGTWYMKNGSQASPITPFFDCAGYFGPTCAFSSFGTLPEFKTNTRLTYRSEPLQLSLRWRWIDGMKNSESIFTELFDLPDPVLAIPEIGSWSYIDLSSTYAVSDNLSLYAGVNNLFDKDPPLLAGAATAGNTDPATYDAIGRRFFFGITYRN